MLAEISTLPVRAVEPIPALLVAMLQDLGKVPAIPNPPDRSAFGFREPTLADMERFKWLAAFEGRRTDEHGFRNLAGLASFVDYYESHDSADVREISSIRGSRRAVVDLVKWMRHDAHQCNRKLIGWAELGSSLCPLLARLGGRSRARTFWEYACQE